MKKKYLTIIIILICVILLLTGTVIYFIINNEKNNNDNNNSVTPAESNLPTDTIENKLDLPSSGNDYVITTKSNTTIRVINEYDKSLFTKNKNLLIMFGSWCPNCQEEIAEIEKIIKMYKDDKNVNVIVIAHEYEDTVNDLISLVENDVDFGNTEVLLDLGRIIRKTIDPEASTVPISYVVNKNGKVLNVHNESITLEDAKSMVK